MKKLLPMLRLSSFLLISAIAPLHKPQDFFTGDNEIFNSVLKDIDNQDTNNAIFRLELLNKLYPNNSDYLVSLGLLYKQVGNENESLANFKKALSIDPDLSIFYNKIAVDYAVKLNYKESIFYFKLIEEKEPNNAIHHHILGILYHKIDCHEESVRELHKAIELNKEYAEAYFNLGLIEYSEYLGIKDKKLLQDIISNLIISDEIQPNQDAIDFAKKAYELFYNIKLGNNPLWDKEWEEYDLNIRYNFLKSINK